MSVDALPVGWSWSLLGQVAAVQLGKMLDKAKNVGELRPYLRNINVRWFDFDLNDLAQIRMSTSEAEKFTIQDGDVLVCEGGEPGRCAMWRGGATDLAYQKALHRVRVSQALSASLLTRQLRLDALTGALAAHLSGSTIKHLPQVALQRYPVRLPPAKEQQRIADKLDTVLARVDACRDRLAGVVSLLNRFRQSVLAAAVAGRLTEGVRQSGVFTAWSETDVQSVCRVGTGSTPLRSTPGFFSTNGTPWITSGATGQRVVMTAEEFVTPAAIAVHRLKVYPVGTLLVAMYGEGKTRGQVSELGVAATINQACAAIVADLSQVSPRFVKLVLESKYLEMRRLAEGGNQPNLNLTKIKEFRLCLPCIEEQAEIVSRVESLFAYADRLEARLATARTAVDRLTPALLAKAFRGELVPQDPNDEPAAELLRRLAESRQAAPAKPRRRQPA